MVANWERRGSAARLRTETQQLLDTNVSRAADDVRRRFAAALAEMKTGADAAPGSGTGCAPTVLDGDALLRRDILKMVATYMVARPFSSAADRGPGRGPLQVEEWRETADEYGRSYLQADRHELTAELRADLDLIHEVLAALPDESVEARGLSAAAGRLFALTAMACTDLGCAREARHMWRLARRFTDHAGDKAARQWVRGHECTTGIYQGRPLSTVLELAEKGLAIDGDWPCAGRAELLGGKAECLALQGRTAEAISTLHEAERTFEMLPSRVATDVESIYGWPAHRLCHAKSFVYSTTGQTAKAYAAQDDALSVYPRARLISRAQIELHRAECLIRDGDIGDGIRQAVTALGVLPGGRRRRFVLEVAAKVSEAIPDKERRRPDALDFRDQLAASGKQELSSGVPV
ncbi:hypothetical protein GCM10012284_61920 [Mangrovihabitans endophyticus]|uniref:Uncharacterized protein n=1 Tax=Mangrovihabitans endophyticus TaxID=1751298 RepID=A0A8J3C5R0_9ACTN|nr:hypothetical protein GCM10012284_61920 [Mangrovihabitans endophyticus]